MSSVATPTKRYEELHELRDLPRALMGGTREMREEGEEFLPQHPAESEAAYEVRLNGTTLYNGFSDTVKKMSGKVFSKPINTSKVNSQLQSLLGNIDGAGRNINSFFYDLFKEGMVDGIDYVLVDFPPLALEGGAQATMADQISTGARPYTVLVKADQVIGWRSKNVGGAQILTEVRIEEKFVEEGADWTEVEVHQIRVLQQGSFAIYRKKIDAQGKEQWPLFSQGTTSLDFIPLVPLYINRVGFFEGEPPLMELAELNLEHWISSSEQRKALTFARFAMLALSGVDADSSVEVGPDKVLKLPSGATANYVESSGAAISAGRADLEAVEKRMQHAGMTVRVQTPTGVTATAAAIDSVDADSALMAAARSLQDTIDQVLFVMGKYLGLSDGGSVIVDTDFGKPPAVGTAQELVQLFAAGIIDQTTAVEELVRRGILREESDSEEILGRVEEGSVEVSTSASDTSSADSNSVAIVESLQAILNQGKVAQESLIAKLQELQTSEPTAPVDLTAIVEVIKNLPAPVVNMSVPEQPQVDIIGAMTQILEAIRNIPAPIVNVAMPDQQQAAPIVLNTGSGARIVQFTKDAAGKITGVEVKEV